MEKERIMIRQDKLASMGEMIGNIAHQWRQPLTELGSLFIRLEVCFEQGILNSKELKNITYKAENLITHMSQTIDDFRNFFSTNEKITTFCINDAYYKSFYLLSAALKNHHITIEVHEECKLYIEGLESELTQAILNILGNAKDVLIERAIINPKISVSIFERNAKKVIKIKDNGGGITFEPITKIFEPYVSSKHASSGTGIGLYMTKNIVEKNQKGWLIVYNEEGGAVFEIILS
jgi:C4-dicarboxylate-specific signal transduction histidine kinase